MKVLLDTNVLLDWLLKRPPFAVDAAQIIRLGELRAIDLHFASITLTNAYYIAKVPKGSAFALQFVESIRRLGTVVPMDDPLLDRAATLPMNVFEDAIQAASAERASAQYIVTRDLRDFANSPVVPVEPAALLTQLSAK